MEEAEHIIQPIKQQQVAVTASEREVLVAAGAGSGKTMTLVSRYVELLSQGYSPRQIGAITFTEKAAREMRNRVRKRVQVKMQAAETDDERIIWQTVESKMDAARIGTIHALCAEILRAHPTEAQVDPAFEVIEEGIAATLKAQAVEDTLAWGVGEETLAPIYLDFTVRHLERILRFLLDRRLEASTLLADQDAYSIGAVRIFKSITEFLENPEVAVSIEELRELSAMGALVDDAGSTLADQVEGLLGVWSELEEHVQSKRLVPASKSLFTLRREWLKRGPGQKGSQAKEAVHRLQSHYDAEINPWLGGEASKDPPPSDEVERSFQENLPRIHLLYDHALQIYRSSLASRYALDFDDLEQLALDVLEKAEIRARWQGELIAVLVDEYQDTNHRQQEIILMLQGEHGRLFLVGDARQSIYRFRGADVTVFRKTQREVESRGGKLVTLDLSFRAHPRLSWALDGLLSPILGEDEGPLYKTPFTALTPQRKAPRNGIQPPFVEFIGGLGDSADGARRSAARNLALRLIELKLADEIGNWDEVALLFRASTGFPYYEDELEGAGIPFVTIAGGGFYMRPEVRDVLNMLRAISNPADDLTLAGLLRSPAFGLKDSALYLLRWRDGKRTPLWESLQDDLSILDEQDRAHTLRALEILKELLPMVDRLPVAELLNALVNLTDYRAALAASPGRLLHNLDKLILDAHRSKLVRVRAFLEYVQSLRDVGAREAEAPVVESGAVQLMTIHKAKGLQFPFVVLADASRKRPNITQAVYLPRETGLAFNPDRVEGTPLVTRFAAYLDKLEAETEEERLLYVALTRSAEKLLISGHIVERNDKWIASGWLRDFLDVVDVELGGEEGALDEWSEHELSNGERVGLWVGRGEIDIPPLIGHEIPWPSSNEKRLYKPFERISPLEADPDREAESKRDWRATGGRMGAPAVAVGNMVHRALQRWKFPSDPSLEQHLDVYAMEEGLVESDQRARAIAESVELLRRFWEDDRRLTIERTAERYHELPFSRPLPGGKPAIGVIDLIYRDESGWTIVDFKTDELHDEDELYKLIHERNGSSEKPGEHRKQLLGYKAAVESLLHVTPKLYLCYLNYQGRVRWEALEA